jgi:hypothetical protein
MRRLARHCDAIVRWGLVALIAFTPLAFGTVEAWSIAIMEWGIVTLGLLAWGSHVLGGKGGRFLPRTGLLWPLALFLALCLLQTVPMPRSWLGVLSPGSARLYAGGESSTPPADGVASAHGGALAERLPLEPTPERRPLSVNPEASLTRLHMLAALFALFFLATAWADRPERIVFLLGAVTIVGFAVALFGLVQHLTWNGHIYWIRRVARDTAFGPFVNHNHFAGYVEMVLPLSLSMGLFLLDSRRHLLSDPEPDTDAEGDELAEDAAPSGDWTSPASLWGQSALAFFASMILGASLFLSQSRGGILSALLSALFLLLLIWRRIASRILAWSIALVLPALALLFTFWVGSGLLKGYGTAFQAVEREASLRSRWMVWAEMARHMPLAGWTGHGLGAFEDSFAPFAPPGGAYRWDKAHNDYLQLAWETGMAGCLLILWGGFVYVRKYLWPAIGSREHPLDLFRLGIAVAVLSILLHSFIDFNLQIGANGFLFALLSGLLVALGRLVERDGTGQDRGVGADGTDPSRLQLPRDGRIV